MSIPPATPVTRTEIGGIPTFCVDAPAPMRAGLLFRVGRQDEELWSAGVTHLVEHLALSPLQHTGYEFNGFVTIRDTGFYAAGSPDEIVDFLHATVASLGSLPLQRLDTERRILNTESASRGPSLVGSLLALRYGASGPGLVGYDEWGLRTLGPKDLQAWADRCFSAENAVLWMSGPPPAGLRLALPRGARLPPAQLRPAELELPTAINQPSKVVGWGFTTPRSTAAMALVHIIHRRCHDRLRRELGVSYNIGGDTLKLNRDTLHISISADTLPDQAADVVRGMLDVLDELAGQGITREDVDQAVQAYQRAYSDPGAAINWVAAEAEAACMGRRCRTLRTWYGT